MCNNTITEIIDELSRIQVEDSQLAWQERQLVDRLCLLENLYDDMVRQRTALAPEEQKRYTTEVFPGILEKCRKLADYFNMCPELRKNEQDYHMLHSYLQSYCNISDRLLNKLQQANAPKRASMLTKMRLWFSEFGTSIVELRGMLAEKTDDSFSAYSNISVPKIYGRRRTPVTYHRDTIDYVGSGYSLQPIPSLNFDYT